METPPSTAAAPVPVIPFKKILAAISNSTRWHILNELINGEPLMVSDLAQRLGLPSTNISKQISLLRETGIVRRGRGNLYSIPPHFLVPGQRAVDLGPVVLRLDRMNPE